MLAAGSSPAAITCSGISFWRTQRNTGFQVSGHVQKSGSFFSYGEQRLAQGRDNTRKYLQENPELAAEIDAKVREQLFANKDASEADKAAIAVQQQEEEDDLALLEEDL